VLTLVVISLVFEGEVPVKWVLLLRMCAGLRNGRDVVVMAALGADEYGFGTVAMIATGCIMARVCHTNNCPVGVASQREELRARFPGTPADVVNFFLFVAEEVPPSPLPPPFSLFLSLMWCCADMLIVKIVSILMFELRRLKVACKRRKLEIHEQLPPTALHLWRTCCMVLSLLLSLLYIHDSFTLMEYVATLYIL
jgi:hypothetical protein